MESETKHSRVQRVKEFNRAHPMVLPILVAISLYLLLGLALWWFISPTTTGQKKDFAQLLAQIAGGAALLFGLYFTWRRVEIQQDQQVTERFTRAIDQLGNTDEANKPRLEIRLGGIYALERIAKDSPKRDYATIMEVLTAYVRENAPLLSKESTEPTSEPNEAAEHNEDAEQSIVSAPPEPPRADIQAVLDVLGRRPENSVPNEYRVRLDLRKTDLRGANLWGADLRGAYLWGADLTGANLWGADLRGANLRGADLIGAYLEEADLRRANLRGAALTGANLWGADLTGARELTQEQLEMTFIDVTTHLPKGLYLPASWTQGEDRPTDGKE